MKQLPLAIAPDLAPTFDTFVSGSNAAAAAHLRSLAQGLQAGTPVYLWGAPGSGKTHLLRATAHDWQQRGGRVGWFDDTTALPWEAGDPPVLAILDDCGRYDGARQHAAFSLFVASGGAQIVAAGRVPPVDLPLRDDLRTRLGWGHVFAVEPLSEAQVRAALRREADRRGLLLTDELMDYLLNHFDRDLKHLTRRLDALDAYALVHKRALSVALLRQMLAEANE